ncbi:uncharacterized protein LOC129724964 [Wyeomyia smithii]|uniref:uncharacterized protein LOC129724964 n=1 Tax=Wyeomyia smithii TaxID=174621 RepID=UPI002467D5C0|nr:uncharacterized protein LOC129724964 [Wyeomyia smithii]XP_055536257.1 uncharacterized protein LOC129724964 [Wyeomyia smithii]
MDIDTIPKDFPASNIDLKRREVSHISAWKDREEFVQVYNGIFATEKSDIDAKEAALQSMKVWNVRLNRCTPVSVLCTAAILEVQIFDTRRQQDPSNTSGKDGADIKHLYSGAFTRFINYLTESYQQSGAGRKGSIANRVKEIGIEGFLVELRHLCAHSSVTISIDVFRRSADYCMNWLKVCYWQRELQQLQSCEISQIRNGTLACKHECDLKYIANIYDIVTNAIHKGAQTMSAAEKKLAPPKFRLLQEHSRANKIDQLSMIVFEIVRYLSETMKLPRSSETVAVVCDAFLSCEYMFEAPVKGNTQGLASIHQRFFQMLVARGYVQTYLEKLIEICEDDQQSNERRLGAKFWAIEVALAFRLLKKFKKIIKSLPEQSHRHVRREYAKKMSGTVRAIYENKLRVDLQNTIIIGMSANCPWHLRLSRSYLIERVLNVNKYTKEILPIMLALAEPHLKLSQIESLETAMDKYTTNHLAVIDDGHIEQETDYCNDKTSTPKRAGSRKQEKSKVYTLEDVMRAIGENIANNNQPKQPKKYGVWTESPTDGLDWGRCPLGKLVWD